MIGEFVLFRPENRNPFALRHPVGYIIRENGCWQWIGATERRGYGRAWERGRDVYAHRVMYERARGPIPEGLYLDHLCRNPGCVNPDHLEPVTNRENLLRGEGFGARNARKTHCVRGHALSGDNVRSHNHGTARECRACKPVRKNAYRLLNLGAALAATEAPPTHTEAA